SWWHRDVDRRCNVYAGARDAHGRDEPAASHLDRCVPDSFGSFSRNVTFDVHHRGRTDCWNVAPGGTGLLIFSFAADDGLLDWLRLTQNAQPEPKHCMRGEHRA